MVDKYSVNVLEDDEMEFGATRSLIPFCLLAFLSQHVEVNSTTVRL
jgi:hypothetical protein